MASSFPSLSTQAAACCIGWRLSRRMYTSGVSTTTHATSTATSIHLVSGLCQSQEKQPPPAASVFCQWPGVIELVRPRLKSIPMHVQSIVMAFRCR